MPRRLLYGKDIYGKKSLHVLFKGALQNKRIRWIRFVLLPEEIYDELIQTAEGREEDLSLSDLPIQHANDRVLKRIRRTTKQELVDIIGRLRRDPGYFPSHNF